MSSIDLAKDIAVIASPLVKTLVETWITPKLTELKKQYDKKTKHIVHAFEDAFTLYLCERYKTYSFINLLVFHNERKYLNDLYIPLTLQKSQHMNEYIENIYSWKITNYDQTFAEKNQKILITDTAGMGKSTILKKLYLSIVEEKKGIPIHIELRRLKGNKKILDEILEEFKLINANNSEEFKDFILDLIQRGDFIFLFDGYDEIALDQRDAVTTDIQNFIKKSGNNVFFLTSRPEKALASFGEFIEFQIKPLKKEEAYDLLRRYDRTGKVSEALITKLKDPDFSNIEEFLETPLLVSLLFTAYEYKQTIPFKKHVFYRQVYDALFDSHDLSKGDSFIRTKKANLGIDDFHSILRHVGYVCMKLGRIEFTKDEILNHIKKSKEFNIGKQFKESDFLEDIITNVPLFNKDGLYYRWAHKSIQEYFAAQFIYLDSKENQEKILTSLFNSKEFLRFYNVLDLYYDIDYKSFRKGIIFPFALEYLDFCSIKISSISKEDVIKRRTILFTINEAFLIRMEAGQKGQILKSDDNEYDPDGLCPRAFSLARIQVKQEPELSVVAFKGGYKHLNNTLIMLDSRDTYRNFQLTRLLKAKREDIVTTFVSSQESLITVNGLEQDKLYSLSDISTESPINDPKEFKKVNDLFTIFASSPLVLDYKKTKELAENIQAELNSCDDSFFVDGF